MRIIVHPLKVVLLFLFSSILTFGADKNESNKVLSHSAFIKIFPSKKTISVVDTIVVVSSNSEIPFRLSPTFIVGEASLNGKQSIPQHDGAMLQFRDVLQDTSIIIVHYRGEIVATEMSQLNDTSAILREEEIFPQGEHDYQFANVTIQVPIGWETIASDKLIGQKTENDSTLFFWKTDLPIPSLGWFIAGKFSVKETKYNSVQIRAYYNSNDSIDGKKILSLCKNVLNVYSEKFGSYRFSKLSIVETEDFVAGKNVVQKILHGVSFVNS